MVLVDGINFKAPIVAYNGAHIFHPQTGVRIASEGFAQDEIDNIKEIMEKYSLVPLVYSFIGEKETAEGTVAVRSRKKGDLGVMAKDEFVDFIRKQIDERSRDN